MCVLEYGRLLRWCASSWGHVPLPLCITFMFWHRDISTKYMLIVSNRPERLPKQAQATKYPDAQEMIEHSKPSQEYQIHNNSRRTNIEADESRPRAEMHQ